jgi:hypothetical protein
MMKTWNTLAIIVVVMAAGCGGDKIDEPLIKKWTKNVGEKKVHYMTIDGVMVHETDPKKQPSPKIVTPGEKSSSAPSDAIVLFDGTKESFKNWTGTKGNKTKGNKTKWILKDGVMSPTKKSGYIQTKQKFGSCQLHIEWVTPAKVKGDGQKRGNSGVFLMGYEVQVLDSYKNPTYSDGQAGALYGRSKPLVNVCRKPGQWQSYDIIFHRPIFDKSGKVVKKATFTVLHNGVLIQDNVALSGGTRWNGPHSALEYKQHADKLPIKLQDHGNPVCFRNVWVREL